MFRLLACFLYGALSILRGAQAYTDPDLNLILQNNCPYPVRYFWDDNIGGDPPNVLVLYNQWVSDRDDILVKTAKKAGGRIYVINANDSNGSTTAAALPAADLEDALSLLGANNVGALRARYGTYLIGNEPRAYEGSEAPPGQLVEFTMTHLTAPNHIYDADISNVFYFNGAVSVDMLYAHGYAAIDTVNCRNESNIVQPDEPRCENAGGIWIPYPKAENGPKGICESPNIACIRDDGSTVCNKFDTQLAPLMNFLNANSAAVGYAPQLGSITHSTRMYTCDGFLNHPGTGFMLASTCTSLNRGQCAMPTGTDLASTGNFHTWVQTKCGPVQFLKEGESTWFTQPVRNPWADYIRHTLGSDGYSFAQDEGPYGGNSQCRSSIAHGWTAPSGMRVTACPGSAPGPPGPTPAPTPAPAGPTCHVGDPVFCPGASYRCAGEECCQDGTTCPSAPNTWHGCRLNKTTDCTTPAVTFV